MDVVVVLTYRQAFGTTLRPLTIERRGTLVRALKRLTVNGREYFLAIVPNADGELHTLACMPQQHLRQRVGKKLTMLPLFTPLKIRGDLGIIPSLDIALLDPFVLPSVVYRFRPGRNNAMHFTSRASLTNVNHHIL